MRAQTGTKREEANGMNENRKYVTMKRETPIESEVIRNWSIHCIQNNPKRTNYHETTKLNGSLQNNRRSKKNENGSRKYPNKISEKTKQNE